MRAPRSWFGLSLFCLMFSMLIATAVALILAPLQAAEQGPTAITAQMNWLPSGQYSPYTVAIAKGWYADEGLKVTIQPGSGSLAAVQAAGLKPDVVAIRTSLVSVAVARVYGAPVRTVATSIHRSNLGFCVRADAKVKTPKDMVGKKYAAPPGALTTQLLPAFLAVHGVPKDAVQVINANIPTATASFVAGKVDMISCIENDTFVIFQVKGNPAVTGLWFAEHGFPMLGVGEVANDYLINNNPNAVRGFVRATLRGYQFMADNPEEALKILMNHFRDGGLDEKVTLEQIKATGKLFQQYVRKPGYSDPDLWAKSLKVLTQYSDLPAAALKDPTQYFSNDFLP
jgi:NitT/TauT family transport system substrate-binding protein